MNNRYSDEMKKQLMATGIQKGSGMIKVSVILPVYNEERYLRQCMDSICRQTLKEIEIICVDDGSTDDSLLIMREYEKLDARIRVLTQKNQFAGVARNHGMSYARGEYLLFLDSDDFFETDMLECMYERAKRDCLDIAICHYDLFNDVELCKKKVNFLMKDRFYPQNTSVFAGKDIKFAGIFQATNGWAWDKLFRADFVKDCGYQFPAFRSSEDGFFVYMLMARAKRIGALSERLVFHRVYNSNSLSNTHEKSWKCGFRMLELIREELLQQNLYSLYEQSFVSWAMEYQVYYLKTMHEKNAFHNCYQYIREKTEKEFQLMEFQGEYLCSESARIQYREILERDEASFLFGMLKEKQETILKLEQKGWVFPYDSIPKGCRLILYGAGAVGRDYYDQLMKTGYCAQVRLVDKNYKEYAEEEKVENPLIIQEGNFDYVFISILHPDTQNTVRQWLEKIGVERKQIVHIS